MVNSECCSQRSAVPLERDVVLLVEPAGRGTSPRRAQNCGERGAIGLRRLARGVEGEMQHPARRVDRRERPCMHLAENGRAQRMRREPRAVAVSDRDFNTHDYPRCERTLRSENKRRRSHTCVGFATT